VKYPPPNLLFEIGHQPQPLLLPGPFGAKNWWHVAHMHELPGSKSSDYQGQVSYSCGGWAFRWTVGGAKIFSNLDLRSGVTELGSETARDPQPIYIKQHTENWAVAGLGRILTGNFFLIDLVCLLKGKVSLLLSIGLLITFGGVFMFIVFCVFSWCITFLMGTVKDGFYTTSWLKIFSLLFLFLFFFIFFFITKCASNIIDNFIFPFSYTTKKECPHLINILCLLEYDLRIFN